MFLKCSLNLRRRSKTVVEPRQQTQLENVAIANALQLEGRAARPNIAAVVLGSSGQFCTAHAHKLLFPVFRSKF